MGGGGGILLSPLISLPWVVQLYRIRCNFDNHFLGKIWFSQVGPMKQARLVRCRKTDCSLLYLQESGNWNRMEMKDIVFSRDITAAMLVFPANLLFWLKKHAHWSCEWKHSIRTVQTVSFCLVSKKERDTRLNGRSPARLKNSDPCKQKTVKSVTCCQLM